MVSLPIWLPSSRLVADENDLVTDAVRDGIIELQTLEAERAVRSAFSELGIGADRVNEFLEWGAHEARLENPRGSPFEIRNQAAQLTKRALLRCLERRVVAEPTWADLLESLSSSVVDR